MFLHKLDENVYKSLNQSSFTNEKEIQNIVEENLFNFLNLEFVATEFIVQDFRLDTLAFDNELNSFVIIEYKLDKNNALTDQGYSYLNTMMNNKSKFVLEMSNKKNQILKESDINWNDSKVVFISQSFTKYQRNALAEDHPFELIKIRRFDDNLILLENIEPKTLTSFKATKEKRVTSPEKEIKQLTENDHLQKIKNKPVVEMYNLIKEKILELGDIEINCTSTYIGFKLDKFNNLVTFKTSKDFMSMDVRLGYILKDGKKTQYYFEIDDPKNITKQRTWTMSHNQSTGYGYTVKVDEKTDIDYLIFLIKQKQNVFEKVNS